MPIEVEVDFKPILTWVWGIIRTQDEFKEQMKERIRWFLEDTMYEEAPLGLTGRLKDSITSEIIGDTIRVIPDVYYAWFVESGTGPSRGVYIPRLKPLTRFSDYPGGRLKYGIHPGTPANPFVSRTLNRMVREMDIYLDEIGNWFFDPM